MLRFWNDFGWANSSSNIDRPIQPSIASWQNLFVRFRLSRKRGSRYGHYNCTATLLHDHQNFSSGGPNHQPQKDGLHLDRDCNNSGHPIECCRQKNWHPDGQSRSAQTRRRTKLEAFQLLFAPGANLGTITKIDDTTLSVLCQESVVIVHCHLEKADPDGETTQKEARRRSKKMMEIGRAFVQRELVSSRENRKNAGKCVE